MTKTKKQPNNHLRRERELKGWSQRMLAERLGSNEHVISRWEKGLHIPNRYFQTQLCQLFGKSAEDLGFMKPKEETIQEKQIDEGQSVKRRDFLSLSGLVSTTLVNPFHGETFQQVSALLDTQPFTLQSVDEYTVTLWQYRNSAALSIDTLYAQVVNFLDKIKGLLAYALLPSERVQLCDIISRTTLLAGALLYDMGRYPQSRQVMHIALQAAIEANNPTIQAIIWAWMSFSWTYTKCVALALPCILEANALVTQSPDSRVKAWIYAVQAEIYARLGQYEECTHALQQAEKDYGGQGKETSYLFSFDNVLLDGYKGTCLQCFYYKHQPNTYSYLSEAKEALSRALASDTPTRRKLYYLGDFAQAEARQGEVEAACEYALQVINSMGQIESKSIRRRLTDVRQLLQPYENTSFVKELDMQMVSLLH